MLYLNHPNPLHTLTLPPPLLSHNYNEIRRINEGKTKTTDWTASWAMANSSNYKWLVDYGNNIRTHVDGRLEPLVCKHDLPNKPLSPFRFHPDFPGNLYILKSLEDIGEWGKKNDAGYVDFPAPIQSLKQLYLEVGRRGEWVMWDIQDTDEFAVLFASLKFLEGCGLMRVEAVDENDGKRIPLVESFDFEELEDEVGYGLVWKAIL